MNDQRAAERRPGEGARTTFAAKTNPGRPHRSPDAQPSKAAGDSGGFSRRSDPRPPRGPLTEDQRRLVLDHMPLAGQMARDFHSGSMDREDLEAEALAALVESATAFDPSRGVPFGSFARLRILGALRTYRQFVFHASWRGAAEDRPVFQGLSSSDDLHGRVLGREPEAPLGHDLECREALESAIRLLPRSHSMACRMIYLEGRSREETAAALGVSRGYLSRISVDAVNWLAHETRGLLAG